MSQLENIKSEIAELSPADLAALRKWFAEFDAGVWDRQFEADATTGRLDALAENALQEESRFIEAVTRGEDALQRGEYARRAWWRASVSVPRAGGHAITPLLAELRGVGRKMPRAQSDDASIDLTVAKCSTLREGL